MEIVFNVR